MPIATYYYGFQMREDAVGRIYRLNEECLGKGHIQFLLEYNNRWRIRL
jgi:hypothetical protein